MESIVRGLIVYAFLLVVFRLSGKRTLSQVSTFEFILLLLIAETTQEAMVDSDHSLTNAFLLIATLVGTSVALSFLKHYSKTATRWLDGLPFLVVKDGKELKERMDKARVDRDDIMVAARIDQGVATFDEIEHAALENDGKISIVKKSGK